MKVFNQILIHLLIPEHITKAQCHLEVKEFLKIDIGSFHDFFSKSEANVVFLNIRTPEKIAAVILRFEQCVSTIE